MISLKFFLNLCYCSTKVLNNFKGSYPRDQPFSIHCIDFDDIHLTGVRSFIDSTPRQLISIEQKGATETDQIICRDLSRCDAPHFFEIRFNDKNFVKG